MCTNKLSADKVKEVVCVSPVTNYIITNGFQFGHMVYGWTLSMAHPRAKQRIVPELHNELILSLFEFTNKYPLTFFNFNYKLSI